MVILSALYRINTDLTRAMEMCRACLATGTRMVPMDETFITNYNIITSLDIKSTQDVPLHVCKMCFEGANYCIEFRNKCIASDRSFRAIKNANNKVENLNSVNDKTYILKEEVKVKNEECDLIEDYFDVWNNPDDAEYPELLPETDVIAKRKSSRLKEKVHKNNICLIKTDDDGEIHCGLCTKWFKNNAALTKHLESHYSDIVCSQCQECYYNLPHLLSHRLIHLPKGQKQCHICSKKFLTAPSLEFHYMRVHEMAEKNAPINCKICYASFGNSKKLRQHVATLHAEIKFRCNYCDKGFCVKSLLRMHMGKHKMVKYECEKCEFSCNYRSGLAAHTLRKHTETKVICKSCKYPYKDQKGLDQHVCKFGSISVICPACGKEFKSYKLMNRHLRAHNDTAWYKCDKCPSTFKYRNSYKIHMDKHAGNPRFHCEICQRSFYAGSVLIKHRRVHTGEKPYVCTICSKGFTGNNNLKVHMKVHGMHLVIKKGDSSDRLADIQHITIKESKNQRHT